MTRIELLHLVIGRARSNGFEFRRWYTTRLGMPWTGAEAALQHLEAKRQYYALLFSHEFAFCFWKPGSEITFQVDALSFQRRMADGTIATVHRKSFTRRSARRDAWRFHLREMALAEEPLRYIRRYLHVEEDLTDDTRAPAKQSIRPRPAMPAGTVSLPRIASGAVHLRPLPQGLPAFLRRPYNGRLPTPKSGSDSA